MFARRPLLCSIALVLAICAVSRECAGTEKNMKVTEYEDRIEAATGNYTLAVYRSTFQVAVIRGQKFLLSTPGDMHSPIGPQGGEYARQGLGFQALAGGKETRFTQVQS